MSSRVIALERVPLDDRAGELLLAGGVMVEHPGSQADGRVSQPA